MLNSKLKNLLKHAAEIISFFQNVNDDAIYELSPYMEKYEKDSECVTIRIKNQYSLEWDFLEPLSTYCIAKKLVWSIAKEETDYMLSINY